MPPAPDLTSTPAVARRSADVTLVDGTRLALRPIVPADADALREAFDRLSPQSCEGGRTHLVGVARHIRLDDPTSAEVAVPVVDPYQGRGIGTLLLDALVLEALLSGIRSFQGAILAENHPMRRLLQGAEARFSRDAEPGATHFEIDLPERADELRRHPLGNVLRALARGDAELYRAEPCPWAVR